MELEIITPYSMQLFDKIDIVNCVTTNGMVGVMTGHEPFIAILKDGLVIFSSAKCDDVSLFVYRAFIETHDNSCKIVAEECFSIEELKNNDFSTHPAFNCISNITGNL